MTVRALSIAAFVLSLLGATHASAQCADSGGTVTLNLRVDLVDRQLAAGTEATVTLEAQGTSTPLSVPAGESTPIEVSPTVYEWTASAAGFETRSGTISLCAEQALPIALVPDRTVELSGTVVAGDGASMAPLAGASVLARGQDERNGVRMETTTDDAGAYTISEIPAGFYEIVIRGQRTTNGSQEQLATSISYANLLDDSQVDAKPVSNLDRPETETSIACATASQNNQGWAVAMLLLGMTILRRKTTGD